MLYGISAAVRLGTAVLWFMGWNAVMTSDKFVYLFGRILPSLSLTLSMGLRFVPRLLRRTREVAQAQKLARPGGARLGWRASAAPVASCPSWSPGHWKMPSTRRTP